MRYFEAKAIARERSKQGEAPDPNFVYTTRVPSAASHDGEHGGFLAQLLSSSSSSSSSLKPVAAPSTNRKTSGSKVALAAEKEEEKRPSPDGFKRQRIRAPSATAVQAAVASPPKFRPSEKKESLFSTEKQQGASKRQQRSAEKRSSYDADAKTADRTKQQPRTTAAAAEAATDAAAAAAPAAKCDAELEDMVGRRFCDSSDDEEYEITMSQKVDPLSGAAASRNHAGAYGQCPTR